MDCNKLYEKMKEHLMTEFDNEPKDASPWQIHSALGKAVMEAISDTWRECRREHENSRRVYYFSAEYLLGRMVYYTLFCMGVHDEMRDIFARNGLSYDMFEQIDDVALGNGGLGRLAACLLDSAATHDVPLDGYGLRYKYGLFAQSFESGFQHEAADNWQFHSDPWSRRRDDRAVIVRYSDMIVRAVPYDMPIVGYLSNKISTLRLWQSEAVSEFDFSLFNDSKYSLAVQDKNTAEDITRVLYPNDDTYEGKKLRLRQQYLLASASITDILRRYKKTHNSLAHFSDDTMIQINDTHPTVCIPELILRLMQEGLSFESAMQTARCTFSYTNHTLMSEALETWDIGLFRSILPEICDLISRINSRLEAELPQERDMRIIENNRIHMARLAVYMSTNVNGVAPLHTKLLTEKVLKSWANRFPERFSNKTNGVSQRRFLGYCNPELTGLITDCIGSDAFLTDMSRISSLTPFAGDSAICDSFIALKNTKKRQLSLYVEKKDGLLLPHDFIFDVQIKRMHEYKRQLLNAFSILYIYYGIKDGTIRGFYPTAFIFGAKAAPGYRRAKGIIKYINEVARIVNSDKSVSGTLKVVFVENYNCSYAEKIIPAANISEQISTAGTEASGTGNMKLMMNGAVTLGTYDGANIEIVNSAGFENNYIFGARVEELEALGHSYNPREIYERNPYIRKVVDTLVNGTASDAGINIFREIYNSLLHGDSWQRADNYYILSDFMPYIFAKLRANSDYADSTAFAKKCLLNIAASGSFSSDRTIAQYENELWHC